MMYKPTIGLEIHAELKTKTKMFCDSKNDSNETRPNVNVCPICMGHPGTLPTINKEAVRHILKIGCALGGKRAERAIFDRKNYFYPDLPKGYQISQYKTPLVSGGSLNGVSITRVHLEEDTGRSSHEGGDYSLIDFNRAGVPLMELVTEPVVKSAKEASNFARELQLLLRYLGASGANMERGEMRVEANVSVSMGERRGTKVEIKNLNSFKSVERAIEHETKRQSELLEKGGRVVQETRGFDENNGKTFSQRLKEESHDYRYFPDPDLPTLNLEAFSEFHENILKKELPELPWEKRARYKNDFQFDDKITELFVGDEALRGFFESVIKHLNGDKTKIRLASNYITSDLLGMVGESKNFKIIPKHFAELVALIDEGTFSSRNAKETLKLMFEHIEEGPKEIAEKRGLIQKSDEGELKAVVSRVISENPRVVSDFQSGKETALQFLIGQGMKVSRGSANPKVLEQLLRAALSH